MKPYLPAKFEVRKCYGYSVSPLQSDPKEEEREEFVKFYFVILHTNYIILHQTFAGVLTLIGIFTLMFAHLKLKVNSEISLSMVE